MTESGGKSEQNSAVLSGTEINCIDMEQFFAPSHKT